MIKRILCVLCALLLASCARSGSPARVEEAYPFQEGLARVRVDEKYGFINTDGDYVV